MSAIGSTTKPVYVGTNGDARPCNLELHDISVDNKGTNKTIAIITIDGTPFEIKNFKQGGTAFSVTFKDYDGTVLKTEAVLKGGDATPPADPTREGYDFQSWDGTYTNVQADQVVTATYKIKTFTVTFRKYQDGTYTTLSTQTVNWGGSATDPGRPSVTGYNTSAWDTSFTNIKANTTVTCTLVKQTFTVTFKNNGGTVLESKTWNYGDTPSYGSTPTAENQEAGKTYTFTGWSPTIAKVTANATYTAQYSSVTQTFTVTFVNGFGSTVSTVNNVAYGTTIGSIKPSSNPTYGPTDQYTFLFIGWDTSDATTVTSNKTVAALWRTTVRQYTVTFNDYDGTQLGQSTVNYGTAFTSVTKPSDPSRSGYNFTGWSTPTSGLNASGQVIGNCVSVAKYEDDRSIETFTGTSSSQNGDYLFRKGTYNIVVVGGGGSSGVYYVGPGEEEDDFSSSGGSAPCLVGTITLDTAQTLTITIADTGGYSQVKNSDSTINIQGLRGGNSGEEIWKPAQAVAYTSCTRTGLSNETSSDGKAGNASGAGANIDGASAANSTYPYGAGCAYNSGSQGTTTGYVKIWKS